MPIVLTIEEQNNPDASVVRPSNADRMIANSIEKCGRDIIVYRLGELIGEEGDEIRQPSTPETIKATIRITNVDRTASVHTQTTRFLISGSNEYVPYISGRVIIDGVNLSIVSIVPVSKGGNPIYYSVEAVM